MNAFWNKRPDSQPPADEKPLSDKDALLAEVKALAKTLDEVIENLDTPMELEEMPEFQEGVELLDDEVFSGRELLELHSIVSRSIWQMGIAALALREPDPDLVDPLLAWIKKGGPWHLHFLIRALLVHAPLERSLVGSTLFMLIGDHVSYAQQEVMILTPGLLQRLEAGEEPTFGELIQQLDLEKAEGLREILELTSATELAGKLDSLHKELDRWRAAYIDLDTLKTIGRIWGDAPDARIIDHPELDGQVRTVLQSLGQTPRRSVLITGEHGVGKTALIRKVGARLQERGWLVFEASSTDLMAGQIYIGALEERVKTLLDFVGGGRSAVWYVPAFQALSWAGTHGHSRTSALDMILPEIESGRLTVVGELTGAAYQQLALEKPRLLSAFETFQLKPLAEKATKDLAMSWVTEVSPSEGPSLVSGAMLDEAWLLARQYLQDRQPPGCLFKVLEQSQRRLAKLGESTRPLRKDDLIETLAELTSLPRDILDDRQVLDPDKLRAFFASRILGQPEAIDCLVERIALIKAGLADPTRPQGVFLFAGPTGTGKTEIAKALTSFLFGSAERLLRYDMSEFQAPDSLERLVGDGQGQDRSSLTLKIRQQPFSVILLDEFEKAHPKVWDIFLQVFDDGRLTDPRGHTADFRHAIIILTSNLGGQAAGRMALGFSQDTDGFRATEVDRAVGRAFSPEFLNRLDRVVVFRPFSREIMRQILDKELHEVQKRRGLRNTSWALVWEDSALEFLLDKGFTPELGARPLKRAVERFLLTPLAEIIVKGKYPAGDQFLYIQGQDDRLAIDFIDPDLADDESSAVAETDDLCAPPVPGARRCLAAMALNAVGTPDEFADLCDHLDQRRAHLDSDAWQQAKTLALSMTSLPEFWTSPERFVVLGEVEYRDRVETGLQTAEALLHKIRQIGREHRTHYPRQLVAQVAERLHLLDLACRALDDRSPWEAFILLESKRESGRESDAADELVTRLGRMYRQWASRRKMRLKLLQETPGSTTRSRSQILAVSGYAAFSILEPEAGLHVWEVPGKRDKKSFQQHKALVRVVPQPEDQSADSAADLLKQASQALAAPLPGAPAVVRLYRQKPDPLVKDRILGWRTGRLDRVLNGDFDLLGACAPTEIQEGSG